MDIKLPLKNCLDIQLLFWNMYGYLTSIVEFVDSLLLMSQLTADLHFS